MDFDGKGSFLVIEEIKTGMIMQACKPNTQETESRRLLWVIGQPGLYTKFKPSLSHNNKILCQHLQKRRKNRNEKKKCIP